MKKCAVLLVVLSIAGISSFYLLQTEKAGLGVGLRQNQYYQSEEEEMDQCALKESLKVPTVEEIANNPYLYRYNHDLCREKGLTESKECLSQRYLCMQAVYRANLDAYLLEALDIRQLDEELGNSRLGFIPPSRECQNLYERESTMELEYICLRNNLYIENLGKDQLSLLEYHLETGTQPVSEVIQEMVKETYEEVIRVRDPGDWEDSSRFLYAEARGRKPRIPNQALVLEIANAMEYDASGKLLSEDCMKEKCEYLDRIKLKKEKEYSEILGTEVYILVE